MIIQNKIFSLYKYIYLYTTKLLSLNRLMVSIIGISLLLIVTVVVTVATRPCLNETTPGVSEACLAV